MNTVKINGNIHTEKDLLWAGKCAGLVKGVNEPLIDFVNRIEAARHFNSWGVEYTGPRIEEDLEEGRLV